MVRLCTFEKDGKRLPGAELSADGDIVDLQSVAPSVQAIIEGGDAAMDAVKKAVAEKAAVHKRADVRICAPLSRPDKVVCIGMNYVDHCTEQNLPVPDEPVVFSKFASSITDPGADILRPPEVTQLDFEVEMAIVVGKTAKRVKAEDAMKYVAGYTVAHDVSARHWQLKRNGGQWLLGKTCDTHCPIGPVIVTVDEIGDPHKLAIQCRLNGETVQSSNTDQLVFKTGEIIEWITQFVTLFPGDLILTGTPPGVGCFRKPPLWLKEGDVVECYIEKIGSITNTVKDEVVSEDGPAAKKAKLEESK